MTATQISRRGRTGLRTAQMLRIAEERIARLFSLAEKFALSGKLEYADRYVELARKIGMRYNIRIGANHRLKVCRGCGGYLQSGKLSMVRTRAGKLVVQCLRCGQITRRPFLRELKMRRKRVGV